MEGLQKVVRWFLDTDDSPISHQNIIITFWPMAFTMFLETCMQVYSRVVVGNWGLRFTALFFVCLLYSPLKNAHFISQTYH